MLRTILIIEDSQDTQILLNTILSKKYRLYIESSGDAGLKAALQIKPELIILDIGLPEIDGLELCNRFRSLPDLETVPIIILSGRKGAEAHTQAYQQGADNYLEKPFSKDELLAIIESKLKLSGGNMRRTIGNVTVDLKLGSVYVEGEKLELTPKEFKILAVLWENIGQVTNRAKILKTVWENTHVSDRVIDNHVTSLRKKLNNSSIKIESIYSEGYKLLAY
jgi:DNA-binding response OmpR family regulator